MADPLDAYNAEILNRSGPFGTERADTYGGKLLQGLGYGIESIADFGESLGLTSPLGPFMGPAMKLAEPIAGKLAEPTEYGLQKQEALRLSELQNQIETNPDFLGEFSGLEAEIPQVDMSGLDVEYQMEEAAKEKKRGEEAEAFRAKEKQLVDSQGGLNSMSIADSTAITQDQTNEGFMAAMDDLSLIHI